MIDPTKNNECVIFNETDHGDPFSVVSKINV
jgi:hypothetical protein